MQNINLFLSMYIIKVFLILNIVFFNKPYVYFEFLVKNISSYCRNKTILKTNQFRMLLRSLFFKNPTTLNHYLKFNKIINSSVIVINEAFGTLKSLYPCGRIFYLMLYPNVKILYCTKLLIFFLTNFNIQNKNYLI